MQFLILILLCDINHDPVVHDQVDTIELNYVYTDGKFGFRQYIFWDIRGRPTGPTDSVVDWRMANDLSLPHYDHRQRRWILFWCDTSHLDRDARYRQVIAISFRVTHTNYDQELLERKILPPKWRRKLSSR